MPDTVLNVVLLCDNLRDVGQLRDAISQSLRIVLSQTLEGHMQSQLAQWRIPSEPTIYRHRLLLDACAMLFSRLMIFNPKDCWSCHIRADSSPQFGKDYFVAEIDHVDLGKVDTTTQLRDMKNLITRRILPLQLVGSRASSAEHKSFRLTLALSADTADTFVTLGRAHSIAFDMGTESKLFVAPEVGSTIPPGVASTVAAEHELNKLSIIRPERQTYQPLDLVLPTSVPSGPGDGGEQALALARSDSGHMESISRMCPRALPLGDADHAMHHTMTELKGSFSDWDWFHNCLNAISKFFGSWSRLRRFRSTCIENNPRFQSACLRDSFSSMFVNICPALVEHRWEYLLLAWLRFSVVRQVRIM